MQKCPLCDKEIEESAVKCAHCGVALDKKPQYKWYFKNMSLIITFFCVGPFVLPLIWFNPRFSNRVKLILTIIVIIVTYYIGVVFVNSLKTILQYYGQINQLNF